MPTTEIDDIFSGKVSNLSDPTSKAKGQEKAKEERTTTTSTTDVKKKKAKKKRKRELERNGQDAVDAPDSASTSTTKSSSKDKEGVLAAGEEKKAKRPRIVETVRDPSATLPSTITPPPTSTKPSSSKLKEKLKAKSNPSKEEKKMDEALERFKDSRGTGPRKRTEEGFLVYKEDELGIQDTAGDTPLCPFDCDCCF